MCAGGPEAWDASTVLVDPDHKHSDRELDTFQRASTGTTCKTSTSSSVARRRRASLLVAFWSIGKHQTGRRMS